MDYREFMEQVKKDLPERLSGVLEGATVDTTQVDKLQGRSYEGLSIAPEGSIIGLTMDLQPYFQMFNDGISYENIVEQIADRAAGAYADRPAVTAEDIGNYEAVKDTLMIQLIGREGNEEMLQTIPHHSIEDMEIVYRFHVQDTELGMASALVTNSMLERYGITAEQLKQDAFVSAVSHDPFEIKTMAEVLNELMGAEIIPEDAMPMYVASNKERIHGAGVIAYPEFMEEAAKRLGGDFYVLPSSIHEVILIPDTPDVSALELQGIVQSVNVEQVAPEERLSDHIYHYDSKEKLFERSDKYESRKLNQEQERESSRSSVLDALRSNQKDCSERPHKNTAVIRRDVAAL